MRILHVIPLYAPAIGGSETVVRRLSEGLAARGHEVRVLTSTARRAGELLGTEPGGEPLPRRETLAGVDVRRLPPRSWPRPLRRGLYGLAHLWGTRRWPGYGHLKSYSVGPHLPGLARAGVAFRPDLVGVGPAPHLTLFAARVVARRTAAALVVLPCLHPGDRWHLDNPAVLRLIREADGVLALTAYEALYLRALGADPERIRVVGGGVDPEPPLADDWPRERLGLPGDAPVVLFLGRKEAGKGLRRLVAASERLWRDGGRFTLALVGAATPFSRRLEGELRDRPEIVWRDDVGEAEKWAWLRACAVLVQVSCVDSFGLVYLEAWSRGKPVVAGRTGPQASLIDHGRDGLLVGLDDRDLDTTDELAEALDAILARPAWAAELGAAGRAKVLRDHTWSRVVERAAALYSSRVGEGDG